VIIGLNWGTVNKGLKTNDFVLVYNDT